MTRLFTALEVPAEIGERLSLLRGGLPGARWIDSDFYHVTLRFIGDIDFRTADEVADALSRVKRRDIALHIDGLASFGSAKPHSVVARIAPSRGLGELQAEQERIVQKIGLPDPRFFIYWDDSVYGWLASRHTTAVIGDEFVLRRTRGIRQWDMGVRHLNASSNAYRYYIMRNRGHMRHYFQTHGAHRPVRFAVGTFLTFAKELIRLVFVERTVRGTSNLWRGLRDGRKIARDASWQPMPALDAP